MHYCLYCIARGQIRKKSDSLFFFFFEKPKLITIQTAPYCLWYLLFTFQKIRDSARVRSNNCSCTKEIQWKMEYTYFHNLLYYLLFQCVYYFTPFPARFLNFYQSSARTSQTCLLFSFLLKKKKKKSLEVCVQIPLILLKLKNYC